MLVSEASYPDALRSCETRQQSIKGYHLSQRCLSSRVSIRRPRQSLVCIDACRQTPLPCLGGASCCSHITPNSGNSWVGEVDHKQLLTVRASKPRDEGGKEEQDKASCDDSRRHCSAKLTSQAGSRPLFGTLDSWVGDCQTFGALFSRKALMAHRKQCRSGSSDTCHTEDAERASLIEMLPG